MTSHEPLLPGQLAQPLGYAELLLQAFTRLAEARTAEALHSELMQAVAALSGCELVQLYVLDDGHTRLSLAASWNGAAQLHQDTSLPSDYRDAQLLQFCLCQQQVLAIDALDPALHDIGFLPEHPSPWRSLLCLPLSDDQQHAMGVLLCASPAGRPLAHLAPSLAQLGRFTLAQHQLRQRLLVRDASAPHPDVLPVQCAGNYGLIGDSGGMQAVYRLIGKALHNRVNVLLTGETGTGKELVARAIHEHGARRSRAFVAQNCAAVPEGLLESELFGYRKGAFSGADRDRPGLFDAADGGTLFLDEIGDMPLTLQAKLLRVLQEGEVRPLGSTSTHQVDVRILAATHCNLQARVEQGLFREDLYYRLAHFPIELPPLRERDDDILPLARHFAGKACAFLERPAHRWSDSALELLAGYAYPGNVRELKGLVERAVLLCEGGELLAEHFNLPQLAESAEPLTFRERLERVERSLLLDYLRKNGGNQTQTALELGLPRRTLLYRMGRLNIRAADI